MADMSVGGGVKRLPSVPANPLPYWRSQSMAIECRPALWRWSVIALHHDPDLWPDPLAFDPDRFASTGSAARRRWNYLPFGAAARRCLGDHFAMREATVALAGILRYVEIRSSQRLSRHRAADRHSGGARACDGQTPRPRRIVVPA
jgi:hypothetical protein